MKAKWMLKMISGLGALLLLMTAVTPVFAHGKTTAGDYEIEIGFRNEPVLLGQPNSLDLFVTNSKTNEKVNGLEQTLKAELIFGASKTELPLYPQDEQDGAYAADVIPTAVGDYTWHIFGSIAGTPVDISMTSAPDTFGSVEQASKYEFPRPLPSGTDLQSQAAAALRNGTIGMIAGLIGAVLGLTGLVIGLRARQR